MDPALHFEFQSYYKRDICASLEGTSAQIMGYNGNGQCVFWINDEDNALWECLNDVSGN